MADNAQLVALGALGLGTLYLLSRNSSEGQEPGAAPAFAGEGPGGFQLTIPGLEEGGLPGGAETPGSQDPLDSGGSTPDWRDNFRQGLFDPWGLGSTLQFLAAGAVLGGGYKLLSGRRRAAASSQEALRSSADDLPGRATTEAPSRSPARLAAEGEAIGRGRPGARAPDFDVLDVRSPTARLTTPEAAVRSASGTRLTRGLAGGVVLEGIGALASLPGAVQTSRQLQAGGTSNRRAAAMATAATFGGFDAIRAQRTVRREVAQHGQVLGRASAAAQIAGQGAVGTVRGTVQAVAHPVQTIRAVGSGARAAAGSVRRRFNRWTD